jgi:hypothetical protein
MDPGERRKCPNCRGGAAITPARRPLNAQIRGDQITRTANLRPHNYPALLHEDVSRLKRTEGYACPGALFFTESTDRAWLRGPGFYR